MKAIINGKRYDTEKAREIAEASTTVGRSDYGWWEETLYKTPRSGAYFLAGCGNASSKYAVSCGDGSWKAGSKITPLSADEALQWCERNQLVDVIESYFSDAIEDS